MVELVEKVHNYNNTIMLLEIYTLNFDYIDTISI